LNYSFGDGFPVFVAPLYHSFFERQKRLFEGDFRPMTPIKISERAREINPDDFQNFSFFFIRRGPPRILFGQKEKKS